MIRDKSDFFSKPFLSLYFPFFLFNRVKHPSPKAKELYGTARCPKVLFIYPYFLRNGNLIRNSCIVGVELSSNPAMDEPLQAAALLADISRANLVINVVCFAF